MAPMHKTATAFARRDDKGPLIRIGVLRSRFAEGQRVAGAVGDIGKPDPVHRPNTPREWSTASSHRPN